MVIADKPPEAFRDEDVLLFKMRVEDLARRFKNLEVLERKAALTENSTFDVRSITITKPDGSEINELLRYDLKDTEKLEGLLEKLIAQTDFNKLSLNEQKALLLKLNEKIFSFSDKSDNLAALREENKSNTKAGNSSSL